MVEMLRDPETGVVYVYRDGQLVGPMVTMGDPSDVPAEPSQDLWRREHGDVRHNR